MNRKQLYSYLQNETYKPKEKLSSINYLVKTQDGEELVTFFHYEDSFFESPMEIRGYEMSVDDYIQSFYDKNVSDDVLEYERSMQRGDIHYEVNSPQCEPWIESAEILKVMSDSEALDWVLRSRT